MDYKPPEKRPMEPKILYYVYYPLGYVIAEILSRKTKITPNQVTFAWLCFGLLPAYFYSRGGYFDAVIGGILIQFVVVGDVIDGRIAELKNMFTSLGEWFDGMAALTVDAFLFFGVGYGLYKITSSVFIWHIIFVIIATNYLIYLTQKIYLMIDPGFRIQQKEVIKSNYWYSFFMWGRAKIYVLLALFTILNLLYWFIALLAVLSVSFYLVILIYYARRLKRIDASKRIDESTSG